MATEVVNDLRYEMWFWDYACQFLWGKSYYFSSYLIIERSEAFNPVTLRGEPGTSNLNKPHEPLLLFTFKTMLTRSLTLGHNEDKCSSKHTSTICLSYIYCCKFRNWITSRIKQINSTQYSDNWQLDHVDWSHTRFFNPSISLDKTCSGLGSFFPIATYPVLLQLQINFTKVLN